MQIGNDRDALDELEAAALADRLDLAGELVADHPGIGEIGLRASKMCRSAPHTPARRRRTSADRGATSGLGRSTSVSSCGRGQSRALIARQSRRFDAAFFAAEMLAC